MNDSDETRREITGLHSVSDLLTTLGPETKRKTRQSSNSQRQTQITSSPSIYSRVSRDPVTAASLLSSISHSKAFQPGSPSSPLNRTSILSPSSHPIATKPLSDIQLPKHKRAPAVHSKRAAVTTQTREDRTKGVPSHLLGRSVNEFIEYMHESGSKASFAYLVRANDLPGLIDQYQSSLSSIRGHIPSQKSLKRQDKPSPLSPIPPAGSPLKAGLRSRSIKRGSLLKPASGLEPIPPDHPNPEKTPATGSVVQHRPTTPRSRLLPSISRLLPSIHTFPPPPSPLPPASMLSHLNEIDREKNLQSRFSGRLVRLNEDYSLYNLYVVPYQIIQHATTYFTISFQGVTQYGGDKVDFTPLSDWMAEKELFDKLMKVRIFKNFRLWRSFITWKREINAEKRKAISEILQARLFILDNSLRSGLFFTVKRLRVVDYHRFFLRSIDQSRVMLGKILTKIEDDKSKEMSGSSSSSTTSLAGGTGDLRIDTLKATAAANSANNHSGSSQVGMDSASSRFDIFSARLGISDSSLLDTTGEEVPVLSVNVDDGVKGHGFTMSVDELHDISVEILQEFKQQTRSAIFDITNKISIVCNDIITSVVGQNKEGGLISDKKEEREGEDSASSSTGSSSSAAAGSIGAGGSSVILRRKKGSIKTATLSERAHNVLSKESMSSSSGSGSGGNRLSYTERAAKRLECLRLAAYIRVIDYHVIEMLYKFVVLFTVNVADALSQASKAPTPDITWLTLSPTASLENAGVADIIDSLNVNPDVLARTNELVEYCQLDCEDPKVQKQVRDFLAERSQKLCGSLIKIEETEATGASVHGGHRQQLSKEQKLARRMAPARPTTLCEDRLVHPLTPILRVELGIGCVLTGDDDVAMYHQVWQSEDIIYTVFEKEELKYIVNKASLCPILQDSAVPPHLTQLKASNIRLLPIVGSGRLVDAFDNLINDLVRYTLVVERLPRHSAFNTYTKQFFTESVGRLDNASQEKRIKFPQLGSSRPADVVFSSEGPEIMSMFDDNKDFVEATKVINDIVVQGHKDVVDFTESLEGYVRTLDWNSDLLEVETRCAPTFSSLEKERFEAQEKKKKLMKERRMQGDSLIDDDLGGMDVIGVGDDRAASRLSVIGGGLDFGAEDSEEEKLRLRRKRDQKRKRGMPTLKQKDVNSLIQGHAQLKAQLELVRSMPSCVVVPPFCVDLAPVRQILEGPPTRRLARLRRLLPLILHDACDSLHFETQDMVNALKTESQTVKQFCGYLQDLDRVVETGLKEVDACFAVVNSLHDAMKPNDIDLEDEVRALFTNTSSAVKQLRDSVTVCESGRAGRVAEFSEQLMVQINQLKENTQKLTDTLHNEASIKDYAAAQNCQFSEAVEKLDEMFELFSDFKKRSKEYLKYQQALGMEPASFNLLDDSFNECSMHRSVWHSLRDWDTKSKEWRGEGFRAVDADGVTLEVQAFYKLSVRAERQLNDTKVVGVLRSRVDEFKKALPAISDLRNPALVQRHLDRVWELLGEPEQGQDAVTVGWLIAQDVVRHRDAISTISAEASNEAALKDMLEGVKVKWNDMDFIVLSHGGGGDKYILGAVDDIIALMDDHLVTLNTMLASRYIAAVEAEVSEMQKRLSLLSDTLEVWIIVQKGWMYLESIFCAPDIQRQLPHEYQAFNSVDRSWKELMIRVHDTPNALDNGTEPGLLEKLTKHSKQLERIEKQLREYLEAKRTVFPRFYFLSNDELLDILSQTRNPRAVQPHLRKCFDNLYHLEFGGKSDDIIGMDSVEKEHVAFVKNVRIRGTVETWLGTVEKAMRETLRHNLQQTLVDLAACEDDRIEWIKTHKAQLLIAVSQINWTRSVLECLDRDAAIDGANSLNTARDSSARISPSPMRRSMSIDSHGGDHHSDVMSDHGAGYQPSALVEFREHWVQSLEDVVALVSSDLSPLLRKSVVALITIEVHARDIIDELIENKIRDKHEFEWTKRLRYVWNEEEQDCFIHQTDAAFRYAYEYLGASSRLVITPLTDRIYMTLTGALHLCLGGSPAGPAGTGKTETVKDLAKAVARFSVVLNCSETINSTTMSAFFKGLSAAGAVGCFDEFNRIQIDVLSVIAQQILQIRTALLLNKQQFEFEGSNLRLDKNLGYFITMNPGYAGRTELPDNLKVLFRPVSCMVPDYALIAEIILFAEGFRTARPLSQKMTQLYKLSSEQLSQQSHYDFGMRALKSVLVMAGSLMRAAPDQEEDVVLIRAMVGSNVPKFLKEDADLFMGIVQDLFPGAEIDEVKQISLEKMLMNVVESFGLIPHPVQIGKAVQLFDTMNIRHGVMLVGKTGGSKTVIWHILKRALTLLSEQGVLQADGKSTFNKVTSYCLNPKCINMGELYGDYNPLTQEWKDGLVAVLVREIVKDESEDRKWLVFDGPVDTLWIESMNTCLDDNKLLCLANSERIKLNDTVNILFEVQDLEQASPATVSRCGMVYVEPEALGWEVYLDSWINNELLGNEEELSNVTASGKSNEELTDSRDVENMHYAAVKDVVGCLNLGVTVAEHVSKVLKTMLRRIVPAVCSSEFIMDVPATELQIVTSVCSIFRSIVENNPGIHQYLTLDRERRKETGDFEDEDEINKPIPYSVNTIPLASLPEDMIIRVSEYIAIFATIWGCGGNVIAHNTDKFEGLMRNVLSLDKTLPELPTSCSVFDVWVDTSNLPTLIEGFKKARERAVEEGKDPNSVTSEDIPGGLNAVSFKEFSSIVSSFTYDVNSPFFSVTVPTVDTVRIQYLTESLITCHKPVLITGGSGVGKTLIASHTLQGLAKQDKVVVIPVNFSAQTSSLLTQQTIESKLERRRRTALGPVPGKVAVIFVDDLNMPALDTFGSQPPIELLRQFADYGGVYDREQNFFKSWEDTVLLTLCAPPGGGRNHITPRLTRHFTALSIPDPSNESIGKIFRSIVSGYLSAKSFSADVQKLTRPLVDGIIEIYRRVNDELRPTPAKSHYLFNMRDVGKVVQGLLMSSPKSIDSTEHASALWLHEVCRVFEDRLVSETDKIWLQEAVIEIANKHFPVSWDYEDVFHHAVRPNAMGSSGATSRSHRSGGKHAQSSKHNASGGGGGEDEEEENADAASQEWKSGKASMFVNFLKLGTPMAERQYCSAKYEEVKKVLDGAQEDFAAMGRDLGLVYFQDAAAHVARITRTLSQPRGNLLLVGVGGSGKQSLTKISCFLCEYDIFQIELTRGYGIVEFKEDIKS
ncbi:Dynein axonemal heavy chain 6, partial [Aduncisulcus paluster]